MNALAAWIFLTCSSFASVLAEGVDGSGSLRPTDLSASSPRFVPNEGQWHTEALGRMRLGPATVWLTQRGWKLDLRREHRGVVLEFEVGVGMSGVDVEGRFEEPGVEIQSYFLGSDPAHWRTGLPTYARARLAGAVAGGDLVLRTEAGELQYDLELQPGVEVRTLEIRVLGARGLELDREGRLLIQTELGEVVQDPPVSWNVNPNGTRLPVESAFELRGQDRFGFVVRGGSSALPITIDPGLVWSSFLGAGDLDRPAAIAVDSKGRTLVAGSTDSFEFPASPGAYDLQLSGLTDAFVTCFNSDGTGYLWSTFLGGNDSDSVADIELSSELEVILAGETRSSDFPTTASAFDSGHNGLSDVFVARLERDGTVLLGSTYLGGSNNDTLGAMLLAPGGDLLLGGATSSASFPTTLGTIQTSFIGGPFSAPDGFLARLDGSGTSLIRSTFIGGAGSDSVRALALSSTGSLFVGGQAGAVSFPVFAALDPTLNGVTDGFVCEVDGMFAGFVWSTFLGGGSEDTVTALSERANGGVLAGGWSLSTDFPTTAGVLQATHGGLRDAFVVAYEAGGASVAWSTYLGGVQDDELADLTVDNTGRPVAVGLTESRFFPVTPFGFQAWFRGPYPAGSGGGDGWLARIETDGSALAYGSFLGGSQNDTALALVVTEDNVCHVTGQTMSQSFPTSVGAADLLLDFSGFPDGFVLAVDFARYPFTFGVGKTTSISTLPYLLWSGFPSLSSGGDFRVSIEEASPNMGFGVLYVSGSRVAIPTGTGTRYIGLPVRRAATTALSSFGSGTMTLDIQPWMVGRTLFYQLAFRDPGAGNGVGLSEGLEVAFHP